MQVAQSDSRNARRWLGLAVFVLILAGFFALLLVIARMPPFDRLVEDPAFFRRCLVVHVNLALVLWFSSFFTSLAFLLPMRPGGALLARSSFWLAGSGVGLLSLAAWLPHSQPIISNYVPTIDHWLFGSGQALFATGVLAALLSRRLLPEARNDSWLSVCPATLSGLRVGVIATFLAALTFLSSRLAIPGDLAAQAHYELLFWGGGHVLQLVNVIAMLVVWLILSRSILGRPLLGQRPATLLFGTLLVPWLVAPLLPAAGAWTTTYRDGFTRLMQFGIFPVVLVFVVLMARALRGAGSWRDPRYTGLVASVVLTVFGFIMGGLIRGANTMIPGHYHASIGAVTVAFMAATYLLLGKLSAPLPAGRLCNLASWQPALFGVGQTVFALGFALAGAYGMQRKAYGAEQAERGTAETLGLLVMGVGGFIAIAGGLLFLGLVTTAWMRRRGLAEASTTPNTSMNR